MDPDLDDRDDEDLDELEFEWYPIKAAANLKKHKISFEEARTILGDRKHLVIPDREHSEYEERSLAVGRSDQGRLLIMCFTERGNRLRIISARLAERWERRVYEIGNE
jgi:uncharacterized DUF497 family protein